MSCIIYICNYALKPTSIDIYLESEGFHLQVFNHQLSPLHTIRKPPEFLFSVIRPPE